MANRYWLLLIFLGAIWGSAFMFIKIATPDLGPVFLVNIRLFIAGLMFLPILLQSKYLKLLRSNLRNILFLAVINNALPFTLFSYASLFSSSNMLAIFNGSTAIITAIISVLWLKNKISRIQFIGVLTGLIGIIVLANPTNIYTTLTASISCILAASCYALSANFIEKYAFKTNAVVLIGWSLIFASLILIPFSLFNLPSQFPSAQTIFSVLWLALISTGLAFFGYIRLIEKIGAVKTSTVAYFIPIFGVIWGYIFLQEEISSRILSGMILIILGIIFTNKQYEKHKRIIN